MHWHDTFSVGVRIIDDQHQQLFALVNELIVAVNTQQQDEVLDKILHTVLTYTEKHFRTEEKLFKTHPQFKVHCTIHQLFTERISRLAINFSKDKIAAATLLL
ncbi:MAG: hemerythrin domain-containing protein, partial [Desulfoprunum sp.]|nr:hemerythrin domain-containing protein [Desulfoprunum sp.]